LWDVRPWKTMTPTEAPEEAASEDEGPRPVAPTRGPAFILVVDDDPDVLLALCETLASEGYEVEGAHDGIEALELISERRPDLIITDLLMPTMTGFELLGALHDDPALATIPTLIITAARAPEAQPAASDGAVFAKPLDLDRLLRAVSACTRADEPKLQN
jgi:CheY-like chemotaxis protein